MADYREAFVGIGERLHAQARADLSSQQRLVDALSALAPGTTVRSPGTSAHQIALQEMVEAVRISKERVERLEGVIEEFVRPGHWRRSCGHCRP